MQRSELHSKGWHHSWKPPFSFRKVRVITHEPSDSTRDSVTLTALHQFNTTQDIGCLFEKCAESPPCFSWWRRLLVDVYSALFKRTEFFTFKIWHCTTNGYCRWPPNGDRWCAAGKQTHTSLVTFGWVRICSLNQTSFPFWIDAMQHSLKRSGKLEESGREVQAKNFWEKTECHWKPT